MKRVLRGAMPLLVVATLLGFAVPAQAQAQAPAQTDVCSGHFTMSTAGALGAPLVTGVTTSYTLRLAVGACASGTVFAASGMLTGACVVATGTGVTNTGRSFVFELTGVMAFNGQVNGALTVLTDPVSGGSCITITASGFFLTGTLILN